MGHGHSSQDIESQGHRSMSRVRVRVKVSKDGNVVGLYSNLDPRPRTVFVVVEQVSQKLDQFYSARLCREWESHGNETPMEWLSNLDRCVRRRESHVR